MSSCRKWGREESSRVVPKHLHRVVRSNFAAKKACWFFHSEMRLKATSESTAWFSQCLEAVSRTSASNRGATHGVLGWANMSACRTRQLGLVRADVPLFISLSGLAIGKPVRGDQHAVRSKQSNIAGHSIQPSQRMVGLTGVLLSILTNQTSEIRRVKSNGCR